MSMLRSLFLASVGVACAQVGLAAVSVQVTGMANGLARADFLTVNVGANNHFFAQNLDLGSPVGSPWLHEDLSIDSAVDPFVSHGFSVQNLAPTPTVFTFNTVVPIAPSLAGGTLVGGSIAITLLDANFDGVAGLASMPGAPVYSGEIDGFSTLPLLSSPFSMSVAFAGGVAVASDSVGLPGPTHPAGPALSTIGITHTFVLSPGDRATFNSFFVIEASPAIIPEPGMSVMFGGLLGFVFTNRRG
ncbi:hypothetical protein Mal64_30790 [Pseudobythopirellula maris]|uniref:PEP-CTERM protein-sorting domain-containing protein n=1 Tax=Pseudobythopirellula maris TaxID=2527991 RepID=A0A5C5ZK75_9BACT|nr:hypothetical protein [Pseudobythopirellula maris]TWT87538.1 hypothetical protein Mal64_30790 [Pseudobythopirellula maris]